MVAQLGEQLVLVNRMPLLDDATAVTASPQRSCGKPTTAASFDGGDVFAACLDHILEAVLEPQHAIGVEMSAVAGVKPSVQEGRLGCCRVAQILGHHLRTAVDDFS